MADDPAAPAAQATEDGHLHDAASKGNLAQMKAALNAGADVNSRDKDGWTPIMVASGVGRENVIPVLLARKGIELNAENDNSWTALMIAAVMGRGTVIQLLLEAGADPEVKNKFGKTALDLAQEGTDPTAAEFLMKGAQAQAASAAA